MTQFRNVAWILIAFIIGKGLLNATFTLGPHIVSKLMPERATMLIGTFIGVGTMAGAVGPLVSGSLVQMGGADVVKGYDYTILLMAGFALAAGLLLLLFTNPDKFAKKNAAIRLDESENPGVKG
ncbi:MFS transporter [Cytobacillus purgationiresistens]|uniref:MFS transporter n=1 Tax=Cytobacillus purgationiresistens TaxID=863449 RepID=UPI0027D7A9AE|nr:MFS transporter [Cytobacillus purgationiresistens]